MRGQLALALGLAALLVSTGATRDQPQPDDDSEGDSASFMVIVRHAEGRSCSAALVSLRTALSSAACALSGADMWVVAPAPGGAPGGAQRVVRVALAAGGEALDAGQSPGDPWAGAAADLALLELAAPLPLARPILMATDPADCKSPQLCHIVRAFTHSSHRSAGEGGSVSAARWGVRLRIVDARLEAGAVCASRGPRWSHLRDRTLCLAGPDLCQSDRGTGVVCGGKLCGVLSRSAGGAPDCGDVHAAANLPRWRSFLHCAHRRGACGRDGECASLCTERLLAEERPPRAGGGGEAEEDRRVPPSPAPLHLASSDSTTVACGGGSCESRRAPPRTAVPSTRSPPRRTPSMEPASQQSDSELRLRSAIEFEPNRADFRAEATSASARVLLKAGEYGDNAAEYGAMEDVALLSAPPRTAAVTGPPPLHSLHAATSAPRDQAIDTEATAPRVQSLDPEPTAHRVQSLDLEPTHVKPAHYSAGTTLAVLIGPSLVFVLIMITVVL